jgi:hypothetical protein
MKSPMEAALRKPVSVENLRSFGCEAYVKLEGHLRKLDKRSKKCIFVGYEDHEGVYKFYDPHTQRLIISRSAAFNEIIFPNGNEPGSEQFVCESEEVDDALEDVSNCNPETITVPSPDVAQVSDSDQDEEFFDIPPSPRQDPISTSSSETAASDSGYRTRSGRVVNQPDRLALKVQPDIQFLTREQSKSVDQIQALVAEASANEPKSVKEAFNSDAKNEWVAAMNAEIHSLEEHDVFAAVDCPKNVVPLTGMWVFRLKRDVNGVVLKYKARLVVRGFDQEIDQNTFAPTADITSTRLLMSLASDPCFLIEQIDVKTAFLYGELEVAEYMEIPFGAKGHGTGKVWKLKKALYGLKNAPRSWYLKLRKTLNGLGFFDSKVDQCLYSNAQKSLFFVVHVDDFFVISKDAKLIRSFVDQLQRSFDLTVIGEPREFLGMKIIRNRAKSTLCLSQEHYVWSVLKDYNALDVLPRSRSLNCETDFYSESVLDLSNCVVNEQNYQKVIGSVLYLSTRTRPDIAFAVSTLSTFSSCPNSTVCLALQDLLGYLKATANTMLKYQFNSEENIVAYSDADWAGNRNDRKSVSGSLILVNHGAVAWKSKKQKSVAQSSTEAEYVAAAKTASMVLSLKNVFKELKLSNLMDIKIKIDSQGALKMATGQRVQEPSKHIDIKFHLIRDHCEKGSFKVEYVPTAEQLADILTKSLPRPQLQMMMEKIGLFPDSQEQGGVL